LFSTITVVFAVMDNVALVFYRQGHVAGGRQRLRNAGLGVDRRMVAGIVIMAVSPNGIWCLGPAVLEVLILTEIRHHAMDTRIEFA
jgi:hypothetical protein